MKPKIEKKELKEKKEENIMREIKIEKVLLSIGGKGADIEKGVKLLNIITKRKPFKIKSHKRIPAFSVRPGLEVGCVVTIREEKEKEDMLKRMLTAVENRLKKKQVASNHFSFGVEEYIEIPGVEYQRDIGMIGLDFTIVFKRSGRRVKLRKIKRGRVSKRQVISKEEIIKFMENKFGTEFE